MENKALAHTTVYSVSPVICVRIIGKYEGPARARDDGGIIRRFLQFLIDEEIANEVSAGHSGAGSYTGFFQPKDQEKIAGWLAKEIPSTELD